MRTVVVSTNQEGEPPVFLQRITNALNKAWKSKGNLVIQAHACHGHWHVLASPAVREVSGGANDGQVMFARFRTNLRPILSLFDSKGPMYFDSTPGGEIPHLYFRGVVSDVELDLTIVAVPPPDMGPTEVRYDTGPKKGTVEVRGPQPQQEDEGN